MGVERKRISKCVNEGATSGLGSGLGIEPGRSTILPPNQVRHLWRSPSVFPCRKTLSWITKSFLQPLNFLPSVGAKYTGSGDYIGITDVGDSRLAIGDGDGDEDGDWSLEILE